MATHLSISDEATGSVAFFYEIIINVIDGIGEKTHEDIESQTTSVQLENVENIGRKKMGKARPLPYIVPAYCEAFRTFRNGA